MISITLVFIMVGVAQPSSPPRETCSGLDTSTLNDLRLEDLAPLYYVWYVLDTGPEESTEPFDSTLTVTPVSNHAVVTLDGTKPGGGGCFSIAVNGFQQTKLRPCVTENLISPDACADEDWVYDRFTNEHFAFYFCASFNADGSCGRKLLKGMSTKTQLSDADIAAFRAKFAQFGEELPPISDPLNNDCQKIAKAKAALEEAAKRFRNTH